MKSSSIASQWLIVLFIVAVLIFTPPFLSIFDKLTVVAGIPLLYLYLFGAWGALIAVLAILVDRRAPGGRRDARNTMPRMRRAAPQVRER